MSNVEPIVNLPLPQYINGLNVSVASTTVMAIAPGQARDALDQIDMPVDYPTYVSGAIVPPSSLLLNCPSPLYINSAVVGANGIDQGVLAASSNYILYLIGDSRNYKPVAGLLSLYSNALPLLPFGYDSWRVIGFVTTSAGTAFLAASVLNASAEKAYFLLPYVSVLSGGDATTFTAVALTSAIPTTTDPFVIAYINVVFTPAAVGDTVQLRPTGSGSGTTGLVTIVGVAAGVSQTQCVAVMTGVAAGVPSIDYKVTQASDSVSLLVEGYSVTLA